MTRTLASGTLNMAVRLPCTAHGDRLALEADPIVQRILTAAPDHDLRRVFVGHHGANARNRLGLAGIDADKARVRTRAAKHASDEHPWKVDVTRIFRAAGHALER